MQERESGVDPTDVHEVTWFVVERPVGGATVSVREPGDGSGESPIGCEF